MKDNRLLWTGAAHFSTSHCSCVSNSSLSRGSGLAMKSLICQFQLVKRRLKEQKQTSRLLLYVGWLATFLWACLFAHDTIGRMAVVRGGEETFIITTDTEFNICICSIDTS